MVDRVMEMEEGTRLYLLAPVVRGRKGEYKKELQDYARRGFQRVRIDGEMYDLDDVPDLDKKYKHDIEVVVDRLVVKEGLQVRLADSFETALALADGIAYTDDADAKPSEAPKGKKVASKITCQRAARYFRQSSPAPYLGSLLMRSNPGYSRSTTLLERALHVTAWAQRCSSTLNW